MRLIFDIGHPAHVHYFRNAIRELEGHGHQVKITTRNKDIAIELLEAYRLPYQLIAKNVRSLLGKILEMAKSERMLWRIAREFRPDLFVSFGLPAPAHIGKLLSIPSIGFDDTDTAFFNNLISVPFTDFILTPECYTKTYGKRHLRFSSYMELAALHPKRYAPDPSVLELLGLSRNEKYAIIRFVSWDASHDIGQSGMTSELKRDLVRKLSERGRVFISSESALNGDLRSYRIHLPPDRMHDALAYASLYVGEGATMASEAAMLGTPSIYVNSTVPGYCQELEKRYGLIINSQKYETVLAHSLEIMERGAKKAEWIGKRDRMLKDKIDLTAFIVWFIERFPESVREFRCNPHIQFRFK
jgi:predicted glycosyltransferase